MIETGILRCQSNIRPYLAKKGLEPAGWSAQNFAELGAQEERTALISG
jgi:hypothetical protein